MKTRKNKLVSFADVLDQEYGKRGTPRREKFEQDCEIFQLGIMLQQMRKESNLTQEQLAKKCGTSKTYISRIENDASDIRLSTLVRIINKGFGGRLHLSVSK